MLTDWAGICQRMDIPELKTMGKTVEEHLDGKRPFSASPAAGNAD
jgi:hypothetical protein